MFVHYVLIGSIATELSKIKKSSYIITAASFTAAGIYFLFSSL
jgi:arginine exporter protein ArgO